MDSVAAALLNDGGSPRSNHEPQRESESDLLAVLALLALAAESSRAYASGISWHSRWIASCADEDSTHGGVR
jgi:hypothetical protein